VFRLRLRNHRLSRQFGTVTPAIFLIRRLFKATGFRLPLAIQMLTAGCVPTATEKSPAFAGQDDARPEAAGPFDLGLRDGTALFALYLREPDTERAWTWLCRAAVKGHPVAQSTMATRYRYGQAPVDRDFVRAYLWYSRALANGLAAADALRSDLIKSMTADDLNKARKSARTWKPGGCQHFGG